MAPNEPLYRSTFPSPDGQDVSIEVVEGDEGRPTTTIRVNGTQVIVYTSVAEAGRLVVDIDTSEAEPEDETADHVAIAINDHYVHGGPARASSERREFARAITTTIDMNVTPDQLIDRQAEAIREAAQNILDGSGGSIIAFHADGTVTVETEATLQMSAAAVYSFHLVDASTLMDDELIATLAGSPGECLELSDAMGVDDYLRELDERAEMGTL